MPRNEKGIKNVVNSADMYLYKKSYGEKKDLILWSMGKGGKKRGINKTEGKIKSPYIVMQITKIPMLHVCVSK